MSNMFQLLSTIHLSQKALMGIFILAVLLRLAFLGSVPLSLNIDELNVVYEAYSLLQTGHDTYGNFWPVHFFSFGWGENVLLSYLLIPVIKLFGISNLFILRFPVAFFSILTVVVSYFFIRELWGKRIAFWATLLLAISPWHLALSRLVINVALLPFFYVLGSFLFVRGLRRDQKSLLLLSVPIWALSFYTLCAGICVGTIMAVSSSYYLQERNKKQAFNIFVFLSAWSEYISHSAFPYTKPTRYILV